MILWGHNQMDAPMCRTSLGLERVAAFIDAALGRAEHHRMSVHVTTCEPCRRLLEETRALLAAEDRRHRRSRDRSLPPAGSHAPVVELRAYRDIS